MKLQWMTVCVVAAMLTAGMAASAEDVQWVRVTVLLERGPRASQQYVESWIRGGIYSLAEVERRGIDAVDAEIVERVRFLDREMREIEESMRLAPPLLSRQYYLPLQVGQQAVLPVIDLNPRLGIVFNPQRFVGDRVVCKVQFLEPEGPPGAIEYTGEPITLKLKKADIRDVIKTFAVVTQREIIVDEGVSGEVTVDLRDVPWDQAFDVVLRTNNLSWEADGDALRVTPIAELSQRKRVRTEATINLPREDAGSATIASRGDEETPTVVLVIESVEGEPFLVAERDGLVHPTPFQWVVDADKLRDTENGEMFILRGTATSAGNLKDIEILATPIPDAGGVLLQMLGNARPWTVLDEQVRRIDAVVGYGYRITRAPTQGSVPVQPVEHIGVDIKATPAPPENSDQYVITVFVTNLDTGDIISAPRITTRAGEEATIRSSFAAPSGNPTEFEVKVMVQENGGGVSYSWRMTSGGKVIASHTAEFEL